MTNNNLSDLQKYLVGQPCIRWSDRYAEDGCLSGEIYFKLDSLPDHDLLEPAQIGIHAKYLSKYKVAVEGHKGLIGSVGGFDSILNELILKMEENYGVIVCLPELYKFIKESVRSKMGVSEIIFT